MKQELRKKVKGLNQENRIAFDKIKNRLSGSIITSTLYKENVSEVLNMLLEGQKRNESYKEIIGENLDEFCEEIIENFYKPSVFYKIFRIAYIFSIAIRIRIIFDIIFYYDKSIILKSFLGELREVNIAAYGIWALTSLVFFLSQDFAINTSLKKFSTKSFGIALLLISFYLQASLEENINFTYVVNINYALLTLVVILIILFYQIYNRRIISKFRIKY